MFSSFALIFLIISTIASHLKVDAFVPSRLSVRSTNQNRLFSDRSEYYELLNRNELSNSPAITSSLNPYEIEELNKGLVGSPGFVSSVPISTQAQSRKELAKMVVSAAVLYLSLNIRMKEMTEKLDYRGKNEKESNNDIPIIMPNGIQYTDLSPVINNSEQNVLSEFNIEPARGDEMILLAKLYYNGLHINKGNDNLLLSFLCLENGKFQEVYSVENSNFKDVPLNGLKEAMSGMKYNNRRKVIIPAYLAFGNEGLSPFIPGGAAVMYELTLSKKIQ